MAGTKRTFQDVCLFVRFWGIVLQNYFHDQIEQY
jgi:hypothetical protein